MRGRAVAGIEDQGLGVPGEVDHAVRVGLNVSAYPPAWWRCKYLKLRNSSGYNRAVSRPGVTSRDKSGSDAGAGWRWLSLVISAACFVISAAGAIASVVICLLSSVPVPPVPRVIWLSLVIGVFTLGIGTLNRNGQSWTENRWLTRAMAIAFAVALISFLSGFVQLAHGQPEIIHGAYYGDNHGTLTRVSHDTYLWAARAEARMFSGGASAFYVFAVGRYGKRWLDD